jgi:hypothetical protein
MGIDRLFMVQLAGGQPDDKAYQQPVRAASFEKSENGLVFLTSDGSLAAYFDLGAILGWREIVEDGNSN